MSGDDLRRHCSACDKPVHDLSAMRQADAAALLRVHAGALPCVRYTAAADGTLRFRDLVPRASLTRKLRTTLAASLLAACTPHGDSESPEPDDPPLELAARPIQRPDLPPPADPPQDACDPQPGPDLAVPVPVAAGPDLADLSPEERHKLESIQAALDQVDARIQALTPPRPERRFQGVVVAPLHPETAATRAERARLLELERQALAGQ